MLHYPRWKTALILIITLYGLLAVVPNFLSEEARGRLFWPLPTQALNLGLDLQGGAHLLFTVKVEDVFAERLESVREDVRQKLRELRIRYTGLRLEQNAIVVTITDADRLAEARKAIAELAQPVAGTALGGGLPDLDVSVEGEGRIRIIMTEEAKVAMRRSVVSESIEVVRKRIDELGTREPVIQREGADRILVQVPGESDPTRIQEIVSKTARLTFHRQDTTVTVEEARAGNKPAQSDIFKMRESEGGGEILLEKRVVISGEMLTDARSTPDEFGRPAVSFTLSNEGALRFGDFSSKNIGRVFAIVLDDEVISAPVIRSAILGGSGQISGGFASFEEAENLAILLRAGALPADLVPYASSSVGADLGADSVAAGLRAAVVAIALVILYMVLSYGIFGVFASVSMLINLAMLMGLLSLLGATLTLPGLAGIILTMGMAVDANVLVYERIREEVRNGKSPIASLETGYQKAMSTILDSNITTFIAGAVLFFAGSGPVRGFAVVLCLGIITTIFTAVTLTRLIEAMWFRAFRPAKLPI